MLSATKLRNFDRMNDDGCPELTSDQINWVMGNWKPNHTKFKNQLANSKSFVRTGYRWVWQKPINRSLILISINDEKSGYRKITIVHSISLRCQRMPISETISTLFCSFFSIFRFVRPLVWVFNGTVCWLFTRMRNSRHKSKHSWRNGDSGRMLPFSGHRKY